MPTIELNQWEAAALQQLIIEGMAIQLGSDTAQELRTTDTDDFFANNVNEASLLAATTGIIDMKRGLKNVRAVREGVVQRWPHLAEMSH